MPSTPEIPEDIRRFVLTSIPSVPYLEVALLLRRQPSVARNVQEVARELYIHDQAAAELLDALCAAGVLQRSDDSHYRYAPRDERLAQALDQLAAAYATHLVEITHLIHDATRKSATRFADAFKLRKDS